MASLLIRNVDAALHQRLKARAAEHRRSLEEEVRDLLRQALSQSDRTENLAILSRRLFADTDAADLPLPTRDDPERPPPDFDIAALPRP